MCNAIGLSGGVWEGRVCFQAQKAFAVLLSFLSWCTHMGLRQSVSQQTGGMGFQGARA